MNETEKPKEARTGIEVIIHDCQELRERGATLHEITKCLRYLGARVMVNTTGTGLYLLEELMRLGVQARALPKPWPAHEQPDEWFSDSWAYHACGQRCMRERYRGTAFCPEGAEDLRRRVEALEELTQVDGKLDTLERQLRALERVMFPHDVDQQQSIPALICGLEKRLREQERRHAALFAKLKQRGSLWACDNECGGAG